MTIELKEVAAGLFTTQFPGLNELMPTVLNASLQDDAYISEVMEITHLQTENGGRSSKVVPRVSVQTVPQMKDPAAQQALEKICSFKNEIFNTLKKRDTYLQDLAYEQEVSFHTYRRNAEGEHGFVPHIDFGMVAIVFTMGKDFEFSRNDGLTWHKLSDVAGANTDTVIINIGRLYSTFTGLTPVLHRVTASGSLGDGKLSEISKFTIGFFIELKENTKIPAEIPNNIQGKNRSNWEFLIKNCKTINDYSIGRNDGSILKEDGLLLTADINSK